MSAVIEQAIAFARKRYEEYLVPKYGVNLPISPTAVRLTKYLYLRMSLGYGVGESLRLSDYGRFKRQMVSIWLNRCLRDIFKHGKRPELLSIYEDVINYLDSALPDD